jgi:hypothetical protein
MGRSRRTYPGPGGPNAGLIVLAVMVMLAGIVAIDIGRLRRAYGVPYPPQPRPLIIGLAAAAVSVVWLSLLQVRWRSYSRARRSSWTKVVVGWFCVVVFGFVLTHDGLFSNDTPTNEVLITGIAFIAALTAAGTVVLPLLFWRRLRGLPGPREHRPEDEVEVLQVRDRPGEDSDAFHLRPHCECGWLGPVHHSDDPQALSNAFAEARRHGTNVKSDVVCLD